MQLMLNVTIYDSAKFATKLEDWNALKLHLRSPDDRDGAVVAGALRMTLLLGPCKKKIFRDR